ncbi:hypothetical protein MKX08_000956 [Trichoderma sp. CBMAI-0020]|nr:hypothetical protein MKX08_000956 [Trichoderma sp. CBMAI-0020]WOD45631.1 hypothetical protein [Trichoderma atroviride]
MRKLVPISHSDGEDDGMDEVITPRFVGTTGQVLKSISEPWLESRVPSHFVSLVYLTTTDILIVPSKNLEPAKPQEDFHLSKSIVAKHQRDAAQPRPLPASRPSKTFTIDFDIQSLPDVDENFDVLRDSHAQFLENIFPSESDLDVNDLSTSPMTYFPTPSSSLSHSIQSLHAKPQFNLESAESLLASFRRMLFHFPCIDFLPEDTVLTLAASRPFVLLAILAAASGSRTLQGHSLYDEEFRKVLGLKFVAGGERSIELLQGTLIYCAWYPFHLRPKNKQAFQYLRMAGDMVRDMGLDQELVELKSDSNSEITKEQLGRIRTYLSWFYAASNFMVPWKKMDVIPPFTAWIATCCDVLQRCAESDGDYALSYLVQFTNYTNAVADAMNENMATSEQQSQLMLLGLEAQGRELRQQMVTRIANDGQPKNRASRPIFPSIAKLQSCVAEVRTMLDFVSDLDQSAFAAFSCNDWMKVVITVIVAFRLSFPLTELPAWDDVWARNELHFDEFLTHICEGSDLITVNTRVDAVSASRVVLRVVKDKYDRRIALSTRTNTVAAAAGPVMESPWSSGVRGCPMTDRKMEPYISAWDSLSGVGNATPSPLHRAEGKENEQREAHDLWATMTMDWADNTIGTNEWYTWPWDYAPSEEASSGLEQG